MIIIIPINALNNWQTSVEADAQWTITSLGKDAYRVELFWTVDGSRCMISQHGKNLNSVVGCALELFKRRA